MGKKTLYKTRKMTLREPLGWRAWACCLWGSYKRSGKGEVYYTLGEAEPIWPPSQWIYNGASGIQALDPRAPILFLCISSPPKAGLEDLLFMLQMLGETRCCRWLQDPQSNPRASAIEAWLGTRQECPWQVPGKNALPSLGRPHIAHPPPAEMPSDFLQLLSE